MKLFSSIFSQKPSVAAPILVAAVLVYFWWKPLLAYYVNKEIFTPAPGITTHHQTVLKSVIDAAAKEQDLDPDLIRAVIYVESRFHPRAVSRQGAAGLMQLTVGTAGDMGVSSRFDPEQNIQGGSKYLRSLLNQFDNDLRLSLAAYNAGPGAVKQYGGIPPFPETIRYVEQVLVAYRIFGAR